MAYIQTNDIQKGEKISIHYQDQGEGQPVILIHGWPLSHRMWEQQMWAVAKAGFRCIAYDRRGFGVSDFPYENYDYSTLANDLHSLITTLDLNDVILVGFSMGGGEVVRYLTDHSSDRIAKVALISSIIPLVKQKEDNPHGVPQKAIDGIVDGLQTDRVSFLKGFGRNFFNADELDNVSEEMLHYYWTVAAYASPRATIQCAFSWANADFRSELKNVDVPTLIVHGDADQIVPIETSAKQAAEGISDNEYHVIKNGPHGLVLTHVEEFNSILLDFLKK